MLKSQQLGGGIPLRMPFSPERGFNYAMPIRIFNHVNRTYDNFPLSISLNAENFDFRNAQSGGADIRFKDSQRNQLSYYLDSWDKSAKTALIIPNIRHLGSYDEKIIWMFYGNENAMSQSTIGAQYNFRELFIYPWEDSDINSGEHSDWDVMWDSHINTLGSSAIIDYYDSKALQLSNSAYPQQEGWRMGTKIPYPFTIEFDFEQLQANTFRFYFDYGTTASRLEVRPQAHTIHLYKWDGSAVTKTNFINIANEHYKLIVSNAVFSLYRNDVLILNTTNDLNSDHKRLAVNSGWWSGGSTGARLAKISNIRTTPDLENAISYEIL